MEQTSQAADTPMRALHMHDNTKDGEQVRDGAVVDDGAGIKRCTRCGGEIPAWELPDMCMSCWLDVAMWVRRHS